MFSQLYNSLMSKADQRHADWPLMSSPFPTMIICISYVLLVTLIGPKLMENRKPFQLRLSMIIYNFFMVAASVQLAYESAENDWFNDYNWFCQPVDYSTSPRAMKTLRYAYKYYILKYVEFLDTIFFVLRKKDSQISALHVIHHGILPFSVWWGLKFVPGGHATFFGFINTSVHVLMYLYYGLAALGPKASKLLWWKKYLTLIQMAQFVLILVHSLQLFIWKNCGFPKVFGLWIAGHGVLFLILFRAFYRQAYRTNSMSWKRATNALVSMCNLSGHEY